MPLSRPDNSSRPFKRRRTQSYRPPNNSGDPSNQVLEENSNMSTKSRKERQTNPSTRIHSLRRLLQRGTTKIPATVRREKERELAGLLLDQEKARIAQGSKKNLKRYHKVRFIERQKAGRILKQLIRRREEEDYDGSEGLERLEELIHETEVDLKYTQFSPLGEKYISIFAEDQSKRTKNNTGTNPRLFRMLDDEQRTALSREGDENLGILANKTGAKPPMWYEVEKAMQVGLSRLEALRDGKLSNKKPIDRELVSVGGKKATDESQIHKPKWLEDDGTIDPEDLDSDSDGGVDVDRSKLTSLPRTNKDINDTVMEDGDSDGDGGFFER